MSNSKPDKDFMAFDTTGKGLFFLQKMGYKVGQGLGKDNKGIVNPINVTVRQGKVGLGSAADAAIPRKKAPESGKQTLQAANKKAWKTGVQVVYKSASQLIQDISQAEYKIVDLTAANVDDIRRESVFLVEQRFNIAAVLKESEKSILQKHTALNTTLGNIADTVSKIDALTSQFAKISGKKRAVDTVLQICQEISLKYSGLLKARGVTVFMVDECFTPLFDEIFRHYFEEFVDFKVDVLAASVFIPLLLPEFKAWDPLDDPGFAHTYFLNWKKYFLSSERTLVGIRNMNPYETMISKLILPRIRQTLRYSTFNSSNDWDPYRPDALIHFLETWYPCNPEPETIEVEGILELVSTDTTHILPPWMHKNLLAVSILPRLKTELENWRVGGPRTPHELIFPYVPHIPHAMQEILDLLMLVVSRQFPNHPTFDWARILHPWKEVFPPEDYKSFVTRLVVPHLITLLRTFEINPANQKLEGFKIVMSYRNVLDQSVCTRILETEFFPKWISVLYRWISSASPKYDQISQWYTAWKKLFPDEVIQYKGVQDCFAVGLLLMKNCMEGNIPATCPEIFVSDYDSKVYTGKPELIRKKEATITMLEYLEAEAGKLGKVVIRDDERRESGKQVYRIEDEQGVKQHRFYIDDGVVYKVSGGTKTPVSVEEILR